jgi:hypothetical protein
MPKDLKIFITPEYAPNCDIKEWFGWFTWNYDKSKPWKYEMAVNSKRFFLLQIIVFWHEFSHYIVYKHNLPARIHIIIEKVTLPIAKPAEIRGVYLEKTN